MAEVAASLLWLAAILPAVAALAFWLHATLAGERFWRVAGVIGPPPGSADTAAIVAIVPARDEADVLPQTLPALLAQGCRVVLVDDGSTDGTAAAARRAAAGAADRLTVVPARPRPPGWTGKLNALATGLAHTDARIVLFTDADILWRPGTLAALAAERAATGAVLSSLMVKLSVRSAAERWLIPPFVYFFMMLYPFRAVNRPGSRIAAAAGGVALLDRAALEWAGGLAAIAGAIIDDCALARIMKPVGPIRLALTEGAVSIRRYDGLADIAAMVRRSAYAELDHSPARLVGAIAGLALVFLAPFLYATFAAGLGRLCGVLALLLMAGTLLPMLRFYRLSPLRAAALPVVAATYAGFTLLSALDSIRGRGGVWKGRVAGGRT